MEVDLNEIERRIWNWSDWLGNGRPPRGCCASAERMYLAPAVDDGRLEPFRRTPVDVRDAELLERAICLLPPKGRRFVVLYYHERRPLQRIDRRLSRDPQAAALFRARNLLLLNERIRRLQIERCAPGLNVITMAAQSDSAFAR